MTSFFCIKPFFIFLIKMLNLYDFKRNEIKVGSFVEIVQRGIN